MDKAPTSYINQTGTLGFTLNGTHNIIESFYESLKEVSSEEYLTFMTRTGQCMQHARAGKIYVDFSKLQNYSITLRALAVNNLNEKVLKKAPFLLVAFLKSKSTFENFAIQTALNAAKPLSGSFWMENFLTQERLQ